MNGNKRVRNQASEDGMEEDLKKISRIAIAIRAVIIAGVLGSVFCFREMHMPGNTIYQMLIWLAILVSTSMTIAGIIFCASNIRFYLEHKIDGMYLIEYTIVVFIAACVLGAGIALNI